MSDSQSREYAHELEEYLFKMNNIRLHINQNNS